MIIAHRGIHDNKEIPENSMKAFKLALDKKYNFIVKFSYGYK